MQFLPRVNFKIFNMYRIVKDRQISGPLFQAIVYLRVDI